VAIKDLLLTKGWRTLRGSTAIDPAGPWEDDAPVVGVLRGAGAVLPDKTTTPSWAGKASRHADALVLRAARAYEAARSHPVLSP
jgi:Asp-tRNA(Asn)/Glu-tRNA(Gln) amidotransferase A subunit family amidase